MLTPRQHSRTRRQFVFGSLVALAAGACVRVAERPAAPPTPTSSPELDGWTAQAQAMLSDALKTLRTFDVFAAYRVSINPESGLRFASELTWDPPTGAAWDNASTKNVHTGFTGQEHDPEIGLINMRGRMYDPEIGRLKAAGWHAVSPHIITRTPRRYRDYIASAAAEFTAIKGVDVAWRSGWLSDRAAAFLATGRPVITEDTARCEDRSCS